MSVLKMSTLSVLSIKDLEVQCIVGVYPRERAVPQSLIVDVDLFLDTRTAANSDALGDTVDYARLTGELRFLLESCRFRLVETAAEAIARWVLAPPSIDRPHPHIEKVRVRVVKPHALGGGAKAMLEIERSTADVSFVKEIKAFGEVDIIHVARDCGIVRLRVAPGKSIPTHIHKVMDEHELVLGDKLLLQRRAVAAATAFHWPHDFPHRYDNPSDIEQSILCVDRPPFLPHDEIEVDDPPAGLVVPPSTSYAP